MSDVILLEKSKTSESIFPTLINSETLINVTDHIYKNNIKESGKVIKTLILPLELIHILLFVFI